MKSSLRHLSSLAVLLASLLLAAAGCGQGPGQPGPGGGRMRARAVTVRTAEVKVQDVAYHVKALGSLEAEEMVQVTAEVEGAVSEVRFHEGDRVTRDTVLLRIDPDRYRLEAERAEAAVARAQAEQQRAREDFARRERLARDELIPSEELERSRAETARFEAEVTAARAALNIARQNLHRSEVRAPRAGSINTRAADTGQYVRAGTVLATLVDVSRLRLRFRVSEAESLKAGEGQTVSFRVGSLGDRDFAAQVYHVSNLADPASRQVEVLAWVRNPGPLKPGFFAEVVLATESRRGALVVPEGAIQASEKGFVAFAVEEATARVRSIQVGLRTEQGVVEILSGLSEGETVVVEGSDLLADGVAVRDATEGFEAPPEKPRKAQ